MNVDIPPTLRFSEIPTPPVTIRAPLVVFVEVVPVVRFNLPAKILASVPENTSEEFVAFSKNL